MKWLTSQDSSILKNIEYFNERSMKNLSFPDFEVEKMEFLPEQKILKIYVQGAWLEENGGKILGKGILFFKNWETLSMRRYDPILEKWFEEEIANFEELRDLSEVKFFNSNAFLNGFGKRVGHWLEWKIVNTTMYAEFEP